MYLVRGSKRFRRYDAVYSSPTLLLPLSPLFPMPRTTLDVGQEFPDYQNLTGGSGDGTNLSGCTVVVSILSVEPFIPLDPL